jgi:hypothetical protein
VASTIALVAVTRFFSPDLVVTSIVFASTRVPRPSRISPPLPLTSWRTFDVIFLTMPSFQPCIFSTSTETPCTTMP